MGYHRAFPDAEIIGVDIAPRKHYPFTFVQADAMTYPLDGFDFIHASPPCQGYSAMRHLPWLKDKDYPMLLEPTIERLTAWGGLWLVENVERARSAFQRTGCYHGWLCGSMFGRRFYRHRVFGASFMWLQPGHATHRAVISAGRNLGNRARQIAYTGSERHGLASWTQGHVENGIALGMGHQTGVAYAREQMGIDWMTGDELSQAIPPAYTEYLAQFIPIESRQ